MSYQRIPLTRTAARHLTVHYLQMVAAMIVGMVVLAPVWAIGVRIAGTPTLLDPPEVNALVMATNMTVAMSAWMRYRRHGWAATLEMAAAMYLPFLLLFIPLWIGVLTASGLIIMGHILMLTAMAALMLLRPQHHLAHSTDHDRSDTPHTATITVTPRN